jgi:hypothetical protein
MPFNTPRQIITFALKAAGVLGVGQSAQPEDANDAFSAMNAMLAVWQRKRWLIWHLTDNVLTSTGAQSYSIGPNADFNVARPDRLEAAFFRQYTNSTPNYVDFPLQILEAREDYNRIAIKDLTSFPRFIFYDAAYPWGFLYPWPVPQAGIYELHITLKETLNQFASIDDTLNLPPEYAEAIWTNLVVRLAPIYQFQASPEVTALAKASLATIRGANAQIPQLTMPKFLSRPALYDVWSDRQY